MPVDLPLSMCWFSLCASYCSLLTYLSSGNLFVIFLWHCRQMYSSLESDRYSVWEGELTLFSPRMCIYFQCTRSSLTNSIGCFPCMFIFVFLFTIRADFTEQTFMFLSTKMKISWGTRSTELCVGSKRLVDNI